MVDFKDIQALADSIAKQFNPERIILFGSYATGSADPDSDVDLLVVLPFKGKTWKMASIIRSRTRPSFPMDLLVRTPQQFRQRLAMHDVFMRDIAQKGKTLYEA
ncbi:MAG: nucleotidyltransferase domain-containing protein [Planctomycetota bacterium]